MNKIRNTEYAVLDYLKKDVKEVGKDIVSFVDEKYRSLKQKYNNLPEEQKTMALMAAYTISVGLPCGALCYASQNGVNVPKEAVDAAFIGLASVDAVDTIGIVGMLLKETFRKQPKTIESKVNLL